MLLIIMVVFTAAFALAADVWRPVITSVSPENNAKLIPVRTVLAATFSKDMDPSTINKDTFLLRLRTTRLEGTDRYDVLEGTVTYDAGTRTATFAPTDRFWPDQRYGNVFTATITTGAEDIADNSLEHDYIWSFTTGDYVFNRGSTTSQQNRTASLVIPLATAPPASPPATNVPVVSPPADASSGSPWTSAYAVGIYILILIGIAMLLYVVLSRTKSVPGKSVAKPKSTGPFGDIHPVGDVEGIGKIYTKQLSKLGILNTQQLWQAKTSKVAASLGLDAKTVHNWQQRAELMAVSGIGPQYAELLERSGVRSIEDLATAKPKALLRHVQEKQSSIDANIQGNTPGEPIVSSWIDAANEHQIQMKARAEA